MKIDMEEGDILLLTAPSGEEFVIRALLQRFEITASTKDNDGRTGDIWVSNGIEVKPQGVKHTPVAISTNPDIIPSARPSVEEGSDVPLVLEEADAEKGKRVFQSIVEGRSEYLDWPKNDDKPAEASS